MASGKIGYAVGADVDGFELCPFQTFLAKVGRFFAPLRRRGLCTPLADGLLLPHIQAVRASSFEGIRAVVGNAWNVDLAMAETVSAETIRALNTAYEDLAPFLAAVPDHLCKCRSIRLRASSAFPFCGLAILDSWRPGQWHERSVFHSVGDLQAG